MMKRKNGYIAAFADLNCDIIYDGLEKLPGPGEEVFAKDFSLQIGGGFAASLITASRLGCPAKLVTRVGSGNLFSDFIGGELKKQGIDVTDLYTGNRVPFCITSVLNMVSDRSFVSYLNAPALKKEDAEKVLTLASKAKLMTMGTGNRTLFETIRKENPDLTLVLDTGWQDDLSLKNYGWALNLADYYTPNEKEALKITGESDPEKAIKVLSSFFKYPVVKLGSKGCLFMKEGRLFRADVLPGIITKDTTGAGDAFLGGFLAGLWQDKDIETCVKYGSVTGGICAAHLGCLSGITTKEALISLSEKIIVSPVI